MSFKICFAEFHLLFYQFTVFKKEIMCKPVSQFWKKFIQKNGLFTLESKH